jgi:5-methylcytosine-specific restriction protein A
MARVTTLAPRIATAPSRLKAAAPVVPTYGSGRGGRPWRRKREAVMRRDQYLCQPCKMQGRITEATEVDHITNVAEGGTDDATNLQAICSQCHAVKTQAEARRGMARG